MNENQHPPRHSETLKPGDKKAFCRCWKSKKFPYCDGSHRNICEPNSALGPVVIEILVDKDL